MKTKEKGHMMRISELEEKAEKMARTESMVKSIQAELPRIEDHVHSKLDDLETSLRHEQAVLANQVREVPKSPPRPKSTRITKSPVKKSVAYQEDPVDLEEEKRKQLELLKQQFRPSLVNLLNAEMEKLGIRHDQPGISDNMFKMKLEELRNNRASKIASRPNFHEYRNSVEQLLDRRTLADTTNQNAFNISGADSTGRPARPLSGPPVKRKPKRPANPPSPTPPPPTTSSNRPQLSTSNHSSPGKPHFASTMKPAVRQSTEVASSSDWADSEPVPPRRQMKPLNDKPVESPIQEKTEEDQTSAWDTDDNDSVGQSVQKKATKIESQLASRGPKPVGGHDLTGMAVDDLFDDDSELDSK